MQRPFVNKLGTLLNTVGSLGVGYYLAKFTVFERPLLPILNGLTVEQNLQLLGSIIILAIGLLLRVRDLRDREAFDANLVHDAEVVREIANRAHDRLSNTESILDDLVARAINEKIDQEWESMTRDIANEVYDARRVIDETAFDARDIIGKPQPIHPPGTLKTDMEYQESKHD